MFRFIKTRIKNLKEIKDQKRKVKSQILPFLEERLSVINKILS